MFDEQKIPCLYVLDGDSQGDIYRIEKASTDIGGVPGSDIFLRGDGLVSKHAQLLSEDNRFVIRQLSSEAKLNVNAQEVSKAFLHHGDIIQLGQAILRFSIVNEEEINQRVRQRKKTFWDAEYEIANHLYFYENLKRELSFSLRQSEALCCLWVSFVHEEMFKKSGSIWVKTIVKKLRPYDLFAHMDQGNFAIMLRAASLDNALVFANRLQIETRAMTTDISASVPEIAIGIAQFQPTERQKFAQDLIQESKRYSMEAKKRLLPLVSIRSSLGSD